MHLPAATIRTPGHVAAAVRIEKPIRTVAQRSVNVLVLCPVYVLMAAGLTHRGACAYQRRLRPHEPARWRYGHWPLLTHSGAGEAL